MTMSRTFQREMIKRYPRRPEPELRSRHLAFFLVSLNRGGVARSTIRLARGRVDRGYRVDLVRARAIGPLLDEVSPEVRLVDLSAPRLLAAVPAFAIYLQRERPAVMISAIDATNLVAIWAKRLIVSVRTNINAEVQGRSGVKLRLTGHLLRFAYGRHADAVVAVSTGVADDLASSIGLDRDRVKVIYNPVIEAIALGTSRRALPRTRYAGAGA